MKKLFTGIGLALLVFGACAVYAAADTTTPQSVATLEERIQKLEAELQDIKASVKNPTPAVEERIEKLEAALEAIKDAVNEPEGSIQTTVNDVKKLKKIAVSGYIQARYEYDESAKLDPKAGTNGKDNFLVRRARIKVSGAPTDNTLAVIQADFGGTGVTTKDAYLEYRFKGDPAFGPSVTGGQFLEPFGFQLVQSSAVRETPELARVIRTLFPGEYDRGVKFTTPTDGRYVLETGLFNGNGPNATDNNRTKDIIGRARMKVTPNLDAGVSWYFGKNFNPALDASGGQPAVPTLMSTKNRFGADFQYFFGKNSLKAEYVTAKDVQLFRSTTEGLYIPTKPYGYYAQLTHDFTPKDQGVVLYDFYDDKYEHTKNGKLTTWDLGWIHYLDDNLRLKLFYQINNEELNKVDNNIARVELISTF